MKIEIDDHVVTPYGEGIVTQISGDIYCVRLFRNELRIYECFCSEEDICKKENKKSLSC